MTSITTLAHLSDVHLAPLVRVPIRALNAKRLLGTINWMLKRRRSHLAETANAVRALVVAAQPDHIVVSGDMTNLGLPREVHRALTWLEALGPPHRVSLVPGNHDLYVPEASPAALTVWAPYMQSDALGATLGAAAVGFPYVRILAEPEGDELRGVALIGVNSAEPRPLFNASGAVGSPQRNHLAAILARLARNYVRVVVIHHPPLPGLGRKSAGTSTEAGAPAATAVEDRHPSDQKRGLNDAHEFAQLLRSVGAELVLHGHNHRDMLNHAPGPNGRAIPIVGARSASLAHPHANEDGAGYTWIRIDRARSGGIDIEQRPLTNAK